MHRRRHRRNSAGQHLLEVVVAVSISGYLAVILGTSLAQTLAASARTENQLRGQDIAAELVDRVRRTPYSKLVGAISTTPYTVQVYGDDGVIPNNSLPFQADQATLNSIPLLMDTTKFTWNTAVMNNRIKGSSPNGYATATVTISSSALAFDAIDATITVSWRETNTTKNYQTRTVVSRNGIHG